MAAQSKNNLLTYGALGFGAYWLWTHRQAATTAAAIPTTTTTDPSVTPAATPVVSAPTAPIYIPVTSVGAPNPNVPAQTSSGGIPSQTVCGPYGCSQTSNFSQPQTGPVAHCMSVKPNWNQSQCEQRLANIVAAMPNARAGIAAVQANIDKYTAPMATALSVVNDPNAAPASKAAYQAWINEANVSLTNLRASLAKWQSDTDSIRNDYHNLTGVWL